jgi:glutamine amidotransferase PdxT
MKIPKQAYTAEFKELAVKRVKDGQSVSVVCIRGGESIAMMVMCHTKTGHLVSYGHPINPLVVDLLLH